MPSTSSPDRLERRESDSGPSNPICHFTLAIEYQDPGEVVRALGHPRPFTERSDSSDGRSSTPVAQIAPSEAIACATTHIHSMSTSCDPSLAIPHFQDIVIADVVRTFGEVVQAQSSCPQRSDVDNAAVATQLFSSVVNSIVITLFAKHASLGLCALSEINLQLNDLGHLSAWNPDNHAALLQLRAETFCAYFYQKRYRPFKIIALVSAGGSVPLVAPVSPFHTISPSAVAVLECDDVSGCVTSDDLDHSRPASPLHAPVPTTHISVDDVEGAGVGQVELGAVLRSPHKSAAHTPAPISPSVRRVTQSGVTPHALPADLHPLPADMKHIPMSVESSLGTPVVTFPNLSAHPQTPLAQSCGRGSGFTRFGRDLSPATHARISDRTLSILGLGDVADHRDILMRFCRGTCPLFVKAGTAETVSAHVQEAPPARSFKDERGVVVVPSKATRSHEGDLPVPESISGMLRIYVNDPARVNAVQYDAPADRAGEVDYTFSTTARGVAHAKKVAIEHWSPRTVVALHTRPSPSGAAVVVVEFSRKQEANDFRRYLAAFQKYHFLSVFKVQAARQLISDVAQFVPPNIDPVVSEMKIYHEEVTMDSLLSGTPSQPPSMRVRTPICGDVRVSESPEHSVNEAIPSTGGSPRMGLVADAASGDFSGFRCSAVFIEASCDEPDSRGRRQCTLNEATDAHVGVRVLELLVGPGDDALSGATYQQFIASPLANTVSMGIPHLGGPTRKVGAIADDAVDFVSTESFVMRLQSEVLGSAQIKNPMGLVSTLERLLSEAGGQISAVVKAAIQRQSALDSKLPMGDGVVSCLQASLASERRLLLTLEGSFLTLSTYLAPLAIYTRTLLCDMGACHPRTLGRLNRGVVRQCVAKASALADGIITEALGTIVGNASSFTKDVAIAAKSNETAPRLAELQRTLLTQQAHNDVSITNTLLGMALLLATVTAQWEALFDKASFYNGGGQYANGYAESHSQRYTIRAESDKQSIDTKPLMDQSLRLVQVAAARLHGLGVAGMTSEADLTRAFLIMVRQRAQYFSFYSSSRSHWPLSVRLQRPSGCEADDDYQAVAYVPFVAVRSDVSLA